MRSSILPVLPGVENALKSFFKLLAENPSRRCALFAVFTGFTGKD
jgi:hypothetical protein